MKIKMKRPTLPSDHLSTDLRDEVELEVRKDGVLQGPDEGMLNQDPAFLREVIAALAEELEGKS